MAVLLFGAEVTAAMNHLSVSRSDDPERDKQIVDLVIGGKRVDDVSKMMACTVADVNLALNCVAQAYLMAQSRVRQIFVDAMRLSARRRRALRRRVLGMTGRFIAWRTCLSGVRRCFASMPPVHMHVDPVALALEAQPNLSSTGCDQGLQAQDKRRA
jgi:hypothetical protein